MAFKVGVTRDLMMADGQPCFGPRAFEVLKGNPRHRMGVAVRGRRRGDAGHRRAL